MTAVKIIEEIKHLPPEEQAEVIEFACKPARDKEREVRRIDGAELQRAVGHIFREYAGLMRRLAS